MEISQLLAQTRTRRGLSQAQCAARAGLAASTISRWERGETQPSLTELDAALNALTATPDEKRDCRAALNAPRGAARSGRREDGPPASPPPMGELWRVLRLRRGMSAVRLAATLGVHASTVSRWEAGEIFPTAAQTAPLLDALDARHAERDALTGRRFSLARPEAASLTREEYEREIASFFPLVHSARPYPIELLLLSRIEELNRRAARDTWAIPLLARLYHAFADRSHTCGWVRERLLWCERGLRLVRPRAAESDARNALIGLTFTKGYSLSPRRQYDLLEEILPLANPPGGAAVRSQILREMAAAALKSGAARRGAELAQQSREAAWESGRPEYIAGSDQIWARALSQTGRADEAIAFLQPPILIGEECDYPVAATNRRLNLTAAYLACHERTAAREHLTHFYRIIAVCGAAHLKPLGDRLARKL